MRHPPLKSKITNCGALTTQNSQKQIAKFKWQTFRLGINYFSAFGFNEKIFKIMCTGSLKTQSKS